MSTLTVSLTRPAHSYDILILHNLPLNWREEIEARLPGRNYLLLADVNLARLYDLPPDRSTRGKWLTLHVHPGEQNKNLAQYAELCEAALRLGVERDTVLAAFGGGVTGDIAGFVAATLLRGLRLAVIPTTLLAQVDSSVGGKNGVKSAAGKNLVGTFHQPSLVLIDPAFLDSLPRREYLAGVAEMLKTAVIGGRDFFDLLRQDRNALKSVNHDCLRRHIARCCEVKAGLVGEDEFDQGRRQLLNLGHTFGHVLETLAGYDGRVVHGEAVAVGMAMACGFAVRKGFLSREDGEAVRGLLTDLQLPVRMGQLGGGISGRGAPEWERLLRGDAALASLLLDKKGQEGKVNLVLPHAIGDCRLDKGFVGAEVLEYMLGHG